MSQPIRLVSLTKNQIKYLLKSCERHLSKINQSDNARFQDEKHLEKHRKMSLQINDIIKALTNE